MIFSNCPSRKNAIFDVCQVRGPESELQSGGQFHPHRKLMNKACHIALYAMLIIVLAGCTGIGGNSVKSNYTKKVEYRVDMNWQAAYRLLKDQTIECFQGGGGWSGTGMVNAQLYNELNEAEIQVNNGSWGTYLYIEVIKDGDGALVHGYSALSTWNRNLQRLKPKTVDGKTTFDFGC